MSKISLYPFPFKTTPTGVVTDGAIQALPLFCRRQCNTKTCRDFYSQTCTKKGCYKCPYGFAVFVEDVNGQLVTFTCLDVTGVSDKKQIQKRTSSDDFIPRLTKKQYDYILSKLQDNVSAHEDFYSHKQNTLLAADDYQSKIETLDNTFHELRKLNGRLKAKVEWLIAQLDSPSFQVDSHCNRAIKDIFAASQLITIRLSTYDLILNPSSTLNYTKSPMFIYRKFDKVARLLDYQAQENGSSIEIVGNSFGTFECNDMVELLPYLFLDNAIKYTMWGKETTLKFEEVANRLSVEIISFSQRPSEQDLNILLERGVRSKSVSEKTPGQGLGLYLARYICDANNISLKLSLGKRIEADKEGTKYSDFIVTLLFDGIETSNT